MTEQLTVDAVITDGTHVLLIKRAKDPYRGHLAFPGGRVDDGEDLLTAVVRELGEEVGLTLEPDWLQPLCVLDDPGRDPRPGHCAAHVFWARVSTELLKSAKADSDARSVHLIDLQVIDPDAMAFDHALAIERLMEVLA